MQTLASDKTVPAKKPTREEFEDAIVAWTNEMDRSVIKQHPEDFPNGREDIICSFDKEKKQDEAGDATSIVAGIALQNQRRRWERYSTEQHKASYLSQENRAENRTRAPRKPSAQRAREVGCANSKKNRRHLHL